MLIFCETVRYSSCRMVVRNAKCFVSLAPPKAGFLARFPVSQVKRPQQRRKNPVLQDGGRIWHKDAKILRVLYTLIYTSTWWWRPTCDFQLHIAFAARFIGTRLFFCSMLSKWPQFTGKALQRACFTRCSLVLKRLTETCPPQNKMNTFQTTRGHSFYEMFLGLYTSAAQGNSMKSFCGIYQLVTEWQVRQVKVEEMCLKARTRSELCTKMEGFITWGILVWYPSFETNWHMKVSNMIMDPWEGIVNSGRWRVNRKVVRWGD